MQDVFDKAANALIGPDEEWKTAPLFWLFEGWDVEERDRDAYQQAVDDGVDLNAPYLLRNVGNAPHDFQNGYLLSTRFFRGLMASNQCLAEGTLVATPSGPVYIESLRAGDYVYDRYGDPTQVLRVIDNGERDIVSMTHRGREWIRCTADHELDVIHYRRGRSREKRRQAGSMNQEYGCRRAFPASPLGEKHVAHAYALGALLGDGCSTCGSKSRIIFSSEDKIIPSGVAGCLGVEFEKASGKNYSWVIRWSGCELYDRWMWGRLAHEKTVDLDELKTWDRDSLIRFVAGLIDTDGGVQVCGDSACLSLSNQSLSIIEAFEWCVSAIWLEPVCRMIDEREKYKNGPVHKAYISSPHAIRRILSDLGAHLLCERKGDIAKIDGFGRRSKPNSLTMKPSPAGRAHVYDITVEHEDHFFLLANGLSVSNCGKSLVVFMDIIMSATGMIPIAYRYEKGYDTGVPRLISPENIARFGRRSKESGEIIDYDIHADVDDSWNCGNVIGAGVYPSEKIVPAGSSIRLGSYQKNILENWWPVFTGRKKDGMGAFMPDGAIDTERGAHGNPGSNKQDYQVFLKRGITLQMLTYESGAEKFEGIKVPTYLDEEPPDEDIIGAVVTHTKRWSLSETPYFGITYTKDLIFPEAVTPASSVFHATAHDCPYLSDKEIGLQREMLKDKPWEIGARMWGIPTEQRGKPYYDRVKLNLWIQRFNVPYKLVTFTPVKEWHGIKTNYEISRLPGLLDVEIEMAEVDKDDKRSVWRLYEDREDGMPYYIPSDQADGAELVEEVGDWNTAGVGRWEYLVEGDESTLYPFVCATIKSSLPTVQFAREVLYAARYFNNALIAPETSKGAANATFEVTVTDWPYWFKDVVEKWKTRKPKENRGFCPTADRREILYDKLLRDWFDQFTEDDYPKIPDERIIQEAAAAVVGKTKGGTATRCDHTSEGTLDMLTMYGIMHFVLQPQFRRQIKCNGGPAKKERKKSWLEMLDEVSEAGYNTPHHLGSKITDMGR